MQIYIFFNYTSTYFVNRYVPTFFFHTLWTRKKIWINSKKKCVLGFHWIDKWSSDRKEIAKRSQRLQKVSFMLYEKTRLLRGKVLLIKKLKMEKPKPTGHYITSVLKVDMILTHSSLVDYLTQVKKWKNYPTHSDCVLSYVWVYMSTTQSIRGCLWSF